MDKKRVVVTGMGAITPLGIGVEATWQGLLAGRSGVRRITRFDVTDFPTQFAAEVTDFDPLNFMDFKEARRTARFTQFALAAAGQAVHDAALDMAKEDATQAGVSMGTAIGGVDIVEEQLIAFHEHGLRRINPTMVPVLLPSSGACHVAISLGLKGPASCPVAACATGIVAIGQALRDLQLGEAEVMIAGGAESAMSPLDMAGFGRIGALSTHNADPARACRPFDAQRDGTVMGEGAAALVLETWEHAHKRGAPLLAEVLGYGLTEDAYHIAAPEPSGEGAARAIARALADARVSPDEVDYIVPHGTGTPLNDASETRACKLVFGERAYRIPISSNKSMVGHLMGAAGAVSAMVGILSIRHGILPATINLEHPDPECDLDYVPNQARPATVDTVLANAFGFGGQNAVVVLRRVQPA